MHELSLACSIQEIVEQEIGRRCGGKLRGRVPSLTVRVGSMSGVEPEALSFAWDVTREQGPFPEAHLEIEKIPARALCNRCSRAFLLEESNGECPSCGVCPFRIVEGRELEVRRIVWEDDES
ncbi:MAG: hydrogenase maturation nickel metallochaperone HypA [Candidatus Eisenbacteria bacterium]|nr:hydrogenase maturation nickel metallochaperone HypA [Candidatus Latescibacterota bacterium]MBD3303285.1 hydrogenase maturation nickel metallochaperone HypA [Candidatus Eisenbacteria bacterium]